MGLWSKPVNHLHLQGKIATKSNIGIYDEANVVESNMGAHNQSRT